MIEFRSNIYLSSLMMLGYKFKQYDKNIFILNSMALRIQHSFFKVRAGLRSIVSGKKVSSKHFDKPNFNFAIINILNYALKREL